MAILLSEQYRKGYLFQHMHTHGGPFVMPNPWDKGSAVILANAGFKALGTTSAGLSITLGKLDRFAEVSLQETLENASAIVTATSLPVSIDLEDGFGDSIEAIANTMRAAVACGAVGGSIEDYSGDRQNPIRSFSVAVERVEAAVDAVRGIDFPFMLTARAENFLYGVLDLKDTIARLQAFAAVGADVLYAPALPDAESIKTLCLAVDKPVNILLGAGNRLSVQELFDLGVTRVSLGSALSRAALGGFMRALKELQQQGTCHFLDDAVGYFSVADLLVNEK